MSKIEKVSIKELLDAGVHFGHRAFRWNPKMEPYIYGVKNDIHIIDLQKSAPLMQRALEAAYDVAKNNGKILFVGSKKQAADIVKTYAEKCGQFYVNHRWLGGMLTNWGTISQSIKTLDNIEKTLSDTNQIAGFTKKEILNLERKKDKLLKTLGGIRKLGDVPNLIIILDTNKEKLAVTEAYNLNIPIAAIVDTNSNPDRINYPVPGNDDATRSIKLYCELFANAILKGLEESLKDSGVDIGASNKVEDKAMSGVKKLQPKKGKVAANSKSNAKDAKEVKKVNEVKEKDVSKESSVKEDK